MESCRCPRRHAHRRRPAELRGASHHRPSELDDAAERLESHERNVATERFDADEFHDALLPHRGALKKLESKKTPPATAEFFYFKAVLKISPGSTRVSRVVFGVPPKTSFRKTNLTRRGRARRPRTTISISPEVIRLERFKENCSRWERSERSPSPLIPLPLGAGSPVET